MMENDKLNKLMDGVLRKLGCGPFTLMLLYYRFGSITLDEAGLYMKVSHLTVNKFNKMLIKAKLIERTTKKDFKITDTVINKLSGTKVDPIREVHITIVNKVLRHKRYSNSVYAKKSVDVMSKKVYDCLNVFYVKKMNRSRKLVAMYCDWWLTKKLHLQFNYGLFTCDGIVDEFSKTGPKVSRFTSKKSKTVKKSMTKLEHEIGSNKIHRKAI